MLKKCLSIVAIAFLSLQSLPAFADHGDRDRHDERGDHGRFERRLPHGYVALAFAGLTYFYYEGLFYRNTPRGYSYVEPPIGAIVPALPPGYSTVVVQRTPYYYYQNVYYAPAPNGYVVTAPPAALPAQPQSVPAPMVAAAANASAGNINSYDIYIPNDNGSYTLVTLSKSEKGGFVGPQGEFYPEHPTVAQLKTLYGNSKK